MPKPRVYVETTVPNFYYDFRDSAAVALRREATRQWWAGAGQYELITSTIVLAELLRGISNRVPLRVALLNGVSTVPIVPPVRHIMNAYLEHKVMPVKQPADAWHLALASFNDCDLIVTWNCRHLANPNKAGHIQRINARLGVRGSQIGDAAGVAKGGAMKDEWTEADDVIEEVREIRRQMWAEFDYDLDKMEAYFMELDKQYADRMIGAPAKRKENKPAA